MRLALMAVFAIFSLFFFSCGKGDSEAPCPDRSIVHFNVCPEDTNWVCGCDTVSYINECEANKSGAWVKYVGRCTQ